MAQSDLLLKTAIEISQILQRSGLEPDQKSDALHVAGLIIRADEEEPEFDLPLGSPAARVSV